MQRDYYYDIHRDIEIANNKHGNIPVSTLNPKWNIEYDTIGVVSTFLYDRDLGKSYPDLAKTIEGTRIPTRDESMELWIAHANSQLKEKCIKKGGNGIFGVTYTISESNRIEKHLLATGTCVKITNSNNINNNQLSKVSENGTKGNNNIQNNTQAM